jgi:hypothetical protein
MLGSACLAGRLEARPSLTHQFDGDRLPEGVPAPLVDDVIDEVHRLGASLGGGHGPRRDRVTRRGKLCSRESHGQSPSPTLPLCRCRSLFHRSNALCALCVMRGSEGAWGGQPPQEGRADNTTDDFFGCVTVTAISDNNSNPAKQRKMRTLRFQGGSAGSNPVGDTRSNRL